MIVYRPMEKQDYPAVRQILSDSFGLDAYVRDPKLLDLFQKEYLSACLAEATYTQVAVEDGAVIGVIMANAKGAYRSAAHLVPLAQLLYFSVRMRLRAKKRSPGNRGLQWDPPNLQGDERKAPRCV